MEYDGSTHGHTYTRENMRRWGNGLYDKLVRVCDCRLGAKNKLNPFRGIKGGLLRWLAQSLPQLLKSDYAPSDCSF